MNDLLIYTDSLQSLTYDRIDDLMSLVSDDVHFRDPFNDCHGRAQYRAVFEDMFEQLEDIAFVVDYAAWVSVGDTAPLSSALIKWNLSAQLQGKLWRIEGCSELHFNDGLLTAHYDYWDAAAGLYERFPLLGRVLTFLRRRIAAG
ncbi:MAG: steroid delta-isomerase [Gammaproteobacteria bacterium]|jgi:steroid Delta-isomerase